MQVIIKGGFTYTAEFLIKEEAYAKLLSAAETFGKDNASAMLGLYLENDVHNLKGINNRYILRMLKESTISFRTVFPSNHVTISVYGHEISVDLDPKLKKFSERLRAITNQFEREFKYKTGILEFISGELELSNTINKKRRINPDCHDHQDH